MNANTIIAAALRKLVVIPSGGTPTAAQYAAGLELLNDIVRLWSAEVNLVFEDTREELAISGATQSFTMGASGDFTSARPLKVVSAQIKDGSTESRLGLMDRSRYDNLSDKSIVGQPGKLFYRSTYPNGTFYFNRTTDKAYTLILSTIKQLAEFPDGTTEINLPALYENAFKYNLAVEIAPEMGAAKRVTPTMVAAAERSLSAIVGLALEVNESVTELGRRSSYNIEGDSY